MTRRGPSLTLNMGHVPRHLSKFAGNVDLCLQFRTSAGRVGGTPSFDRSLEAGTVPFFVIAKSRDSAGECVHEESARMRRATNGYDCPYDKVWCRTVP